MVQLCKRRPNNQISRFPNAHTQMNIVQLYGKAFIDPADFFPYIFANQHAPVTAE